MIIQIDEGIQIEIYFDPIDREEGYDDDIRFAIHESGMPNTPKMLASDEFGLFLTATQAEQLAGALWGAAEKSRNLPWPGRPKKEAQAPGSFATTFPRIAGFIKGGGRLEMGQDKESSSLLRAFDLDNLVWESRSTHKNPDQALTALEEDLAG
jgi:hypothetical protein